MAGDDGDVGIFVKIVECFRGLFRLIRYLSILNKYWGYNCSTFMYFVIILFVCIGFGLPVFRDHYNGTHYFPANCTLGREVSASWSITEYYFELVVNLGGSDQTCKYSDGKCDLGEIGKCLPNLAKKWDLQYYAQNYGASFAFALIAVILSIIMMPLLQLLQWKPNLLPRVPRITVFWVMFGIAIAVFVCLLVAYSVQFGHPRVVSQSVGLGTTYCDRYDAPGHFLAGTLCSWMGYRNVGSPNRPAYLPFTGLNVKNYNENWGPRVGW